MSTHDESMHPRGQAQNAGQFRAKTNDAPTGTLQQTFVREPGCTCALNTDPSRTTMLCPLHASDDPCLTMAQVTGRRRKGSIVRGRCTNCGWEGLAGPPFLWSIN